MPKRSTSDPLAYWRVGNRVTRLILLKTKPGHEVDVGRKIERRCEQTRTRAQPFKVFRLFGLYDLLVIQDNASLATSDFVNVGSLEHVSGSAEYVCNRWKSEDGDSFSLRNLAKPLIAVCFLKINPDITRRYGLLPELSFASYIRKELPEVQMLSSLGWSEVIFLISEKSVERILTAIGVHVSHLMFGYESKRPRHFTRSFAEKTVTMIGHSLRVTSTTSSVRSKVIVPLGKSSDWSLTVNHSIACKPRAAATLSKAAQLWFNIKRPQSRLGTRDLEFELPLAGLTTLNELLEKIDGYAKAYSDLLIRTHTVFKYTKPGSPSSHSAGAALRSPLAVTLTPKQAASLSAGGLEPTAVATAVYQFNNLMNTDVSADVYIDLLRFIVGLKNHTLKRVRKAGAELRLSTTFRRSLAHRLSELDIALAQRSQTVFAGFKESPFGIYPTGIGLQRVIKALEGYATSVLKRNGHSWNGFVRFGHLASRMEHFTDILVVPMDATVCARRHWSFTHEIMHVLQTVNPSLSIRSLKRCDQFANEIDGPEVEIGSETWFVLLESLVDVLDYALCCNVDLSTYLSTVWRFLDAEIFGQHVQSQLRNYLWRSFAVIAFEHYGRSEDKFNALFDRRKMHALLTRYTKLLSNLTDLRPLERVNAREERPLDLVYEQFLNEFVFYLPSMFRKINGLTTRKLRHNYTGRSKAIRRLKEGRILMPRELRDVGSLAWTIGTVGSNDSSLNLAWLLSLWQYYQLRHFEPSLEAIPPK